MRKLGILILTVLFLFIGKKADACTNLLVTKGASADGSVMVSYAADSHVLYGELYYWPAADWPVGSKLPIIEWDTGKLLGEIDQVPHTYQVVGNMNEHQVIIGETTYGGLPQLHHQKGAIMDYGSLIYITLQRASTAREAIRIMAELMDKYGYASEGESFSIADKNEVWIMEVIGKGDYEKGAVWVAIRIPDGYVSAHANQARITTFDYQKTNKWNDPKATVFNSPDVISFARKIGVYDGSDDDFSFSDVYAPVDFGGARFCELRVWSFFRKVNRKFAQNQEYYEYAKGNIKYEKTYLDGRPNPNKFPSNRMPLYIRPDHKIQVHEVMNIMRDHLEGTDLDMSKDFGAGPYHAPYRWRPLTWKCCGKTYFNERTIATQQTGFSFVAQARNWLPDKIGGLFWFSVDDAASTVYVPIYVGIDRVPEAYAQGNGSMTQWSDNSAFWVFNQVSNLAYMRYDSIHPYIHRLQQKLEKKYIAYTPAVDLAANTLYDKDPQLAVDFITDYSVCTANSTVETWKELYHFLFMKFKDGNIMRSQGMKILDNGNTKPEALSPYQPGYSQEWYETLVEKTGKKFLYPEEKKKEEKKKDEKKDKKDKKKKH